LVPRQESKKKEDQPTTSSKKINLEGIEQ